MESIKHPVLHKAFSIFVAVALALLMVPLAPGAAPEAQAVSSGSPDWAVVDKDSDGFVNSIVWDNYASGGTEVTQTGILAFFEAANASPSETASDELLAQLATAANSEATSAFNAAAKTQGQAAANAKALADTEGLNALAANWYKENITDNASSDYSKALTAEAEKLARATDDCEDGDEVEVVATGDDPAFTTGTSATATATVTPGTPTVTVTNDDITYGAKTEASDIAASSSSASDLDASYNASSDTLALTAKSAAGATITLASQYTPLVKSYTYSYAGDYAYSYSAVTDYAGWTYKKAFTYTITHTDTETGTETTKTGTVTPEMSGPAIGGDVTAVSGEAGAIASTKGDTPITPASETAAGDKKAGASKEIAVSAAKLFPDEIATTTHSLTGVTFSEAQTVSDPFSYVTFASDAARTYALSLLSTAGGSNDYFKASGTTSQIDVMPIGASDGAATLGITWTYGDTNTVVATHTISAADGVAPKEIDLKDLKIEDQVLRLQGDIEQRVLAIGNAEVRSQANAANATAGVAAFADTDDYYGAAALVGFDLSKANAAQELDVDWSVASGNVYGNFSVQNAPATDAVIVKAMRDEPWPDTFKLAANIDLNSPSDAEQQWIRERPTATYGGHTLAYAKKVAPATEGEYGASVLMSGGDGIHHATVFALADDGHEITSVSGISYKLDTQAPTLKSAEYSTPQGGSVISTGTTLFGKDTVKVELGIVDELRENGSDAEDEDQLNAGESDASALVSGLKEQPKATYHDNEANNDVSPNLSGNGPVYSFNLGANEDVSTDSIKAYAIDNAGNELNWKSATEAEQVPADVLRLVADADAPTIEVAWDNNDVRNGHYYAANRTMTITITEKFFNYIQQYNSGLEIATVKRDGSKAVVVHPSDFQETAKNSNVWVYTLAFTADADWQVNNVHVTDLVGHSATAAGDSFTLDKTAPTMDVVFDNDNATNGNYYNAPRTATITVTEHNFLEELMSVEPTADPGNGSSVGQPVVGAWSSVGDVRTATVNFPGEGVYTLSVSGVDGADNALATYTASEFIIDTTTPEIEISGVENRQAYSGSAQPGVAVHDTNVSDATSIELSKISYPAGDDDANPYAESRSNATTDITVSYPDAPDSAENDGVYTLTVQAVDMAGNTADQAVTWSVNRFGSTYVISDDTTRMLNNYLKSEKVDNVIVTEINPSALKDDATAIELMHDTSNSTLRRGSDYRIESSDSSGWNEYTYNVAKDNFGSDGAYRVLFHSEDTASNTSENTMANKNASRSATAEVAFAVDDTKPVVSFIDLDSGGVYEESTHKAQVSVQDNLKPESAVVKVDGQTVLDLDSSDLEGSAAHAFDVPETAGAHEVVVTAYDAAGNAETVTASDVTVTTDPVKLWMNNTPLFVGTIVGGIVVIGAVAAFFVLRFRRPKV